MSLLITNAVLDPSEQLYNIKIVNGFIEKISTESLEGEIVIDAERHPVSPGLIDPHMHLDKALLSNRYQNKTGTLDEAIKIMEKAKKEFNTNEIIKRASKIVEMASGWGTTMLRTHVDVDPVVGLAGLNALLKVKESYSDRVDIQIVAFPQEGLELDGAVELLDGALDIGADIVGGIPARDKDPEKHIDTVFDLSKKHDVDIDMHVDESESKEDRTLEYYADKVIDSNQDVNHIASHCCSLSVMDDGTASRIITKTLRAGIGVITLPSTNLYLLGRNGYPKTRGLTRVRELIEKGVPVFYGSDNIRDPFNPFGNANILEIGYLLAHVDHMGGAERLKTIFNLVTNRPKTLLKDSIGLFSGSRADIVIHDASTSSEAVVNHKKPLYVIKNGLILADPIIH